MYIAVRKNNEIQNQNPFAVSICPAVQILFFHLVQSDRPYVTNVHFPIFRRIHHLEAFLKVLFAKWNTWELLRQYGFAPWTQIFLRETALLIGVHATINFIGDTFNCVIVELEVVLDSDFLVV